MRIFSNIVGKLEGLQAVVSAGLELHGELNSELKRHR